MSLGRAASQAAGHDRAPQDARQRQRGNEDCALSEIRHATAELLALLETPGARPAGSGLAAPRDHRGPARLGRPRGRASDGRRTRGAWCRAFSAWARPNATYRQEASRRLLSAADQEAERLVPRFANFGARAASALRARVAVRRSSRPTCVFWSRPRRCSATSSCTGTATCRSRTTRSSSRGRSPLIAGRAQPRSVAAAARR